MKTLEITTNAEWLRVFSQVDFDGIPQADEDDAAGDFTTALWNALTDCGFHPEAARGRLSTCHGWNGKRGFEHDFGPVVSRTELTTDEESLVYECIEFAEKSMRNDWTDQTCQP